MAALRHRLEQPCTNPVDHHDGASNHGACRTRAVRCFLAFSSAIGNRFGMRICSLATYCRPGEFSFFCSVISSWYFSRAWLAN